MTAPSWVAPVAARAAAASGYTGVMMQLLIVVLVVVALVLFRYRARVGLLTVALVAAIGTGWAALVAIGIVGLALLGGAALLG